MKQRIKDSAFEPKDLGILMSVLKDRPDLQELAESKASYKEKRAAITPYLTTKLVEAGLEADALDRDIKDKKERVERLRVSIEVRKWAITAPHRLEANDCSRYHKFLEAAAAGNVVDASEAPTEYEGDSYEDAVYTGPKEFTMAGPRDVENLRAAQCFVVKHDWAALVRADDGGPIGGQVPLPAPLCAFELRVSGRSVIALASCTDGEKLNPAGEHQAWTILAQNGEFWVVYVSEDSLPGFDFAQAQARAACVAMDAEVATHEVQRAPDALNKKRAASGKLPVYDFHVVDLSRKRPKALPPPEGYEETGHKKRLHFCRGHWRRTNAGKTWIRWCLKGDPDLGFVDKDYLL